MRLSVQDVTGNVVGTVELSEAATDVVERAVEVASLTPVWQRVAGLKSVRLVGWTLALAPAVEARTCADCGGWIVPGVEGWDHVTRLGDPYAAHYARPKEA